MEARRSRLERMQTLPNIKLISPTTASRRTVLDSTPEIPSDDDAMSCTQQRQQRRLGKTISFVKRVSEGRFFQTDRSPCRRTASPVLQQSLHLTMSAPIVTRNDADQLQQLHDKLQSTRQPESDPVQRQQLNDADSSGVGGVDTDKNSAATTTQTPVDDEDHEELLLLQASEHLSADDDGDDEAAAEITPLASSTNC